MSKIQKPELTSLELSVLRGIVASGTYSQIGHKLGIGHETVKSYVKRLKTKIGTETKVGLAVWAVKHNIQGLVL